MKSWVLIVVAFFGFNAHAAKPAHLTAEKLRCETESESPDTPLEYPQEAIKKLEFGSSFVKVTTDAEGKPMNAEIFSPSGSAVLDQRSVEASRHARIGCTEDIEGNEFIVDYRYRLTARMKGKALDSVAASVTRVTRPMVDFQKITPVPPHCSQSRKADGTMAMNCNHDGACQLGGDTLPKYPRDDLNRGNSGVVRLLVNVDPATGRASSVDTLQATKFKGLNAAAVDAAMATKYRCLGENPNLTPEIRYEFSSGP